MPLEIAGTIAGDAMPQGEVLRARGRADGIGLNEAERINRSLKGLGRKQAAGDGKVSISQGIVKGEKIVTNVTDDLVDGRAVVE